MTLQQLRYLCEVVDQGFNVTLAARRLHTSQPGISAQIRQLERELGTDILVRRGNRLLGLTEVGMNIVAYARRVLGEATNLRSAAEEFRQAESGQLTVATTHLHARYALLDVIRAFSKKHPGVRLSLVQGSIPEIDRHVLSGHADIGLSTGSDPVPKELVLLPAYALSRSVIAPTGHPILAEKKITLKHIAQYPLIVYDTNFSSGATVFEAFRHRGLEPNVVLTAIDADVIKAYVGAGLGIAVLQTMAYDPAIDRKIAARPADHLFAPSITQIALRRDRYLRRHVIEFIEMVAPKWTRDAVEKRLRS